MAETETLQTGDEPAVDFESLLAPISPEEPSGESLRYDPIWDRIKELRREDDPSLPQGVWKHELKRADWSEVARLCHDALETRTKDLKIAGWLAEAWLKIHGFTGLEPGLRLIAGLCEGFWDDVHPRVEDDGDPALRLAPLEWIDDHLTGELKKVPITHPEGDAPPYDWLDWERALHYSMMAQAVPDGQEAAKDQITREKVQVSVTVTPTTFYQDLARQLRRGEEGLAELATTTAARVEDDAPSFRQIGEALAAIHAFVEKILQQRAEAEEGLMPSADEDDAAHGLVGVAEIGAAGRIRSRAEAYRQLNAAADYLLRTEPHSPAPYIVKRAVAWGNMPLADLFKELMQTGADLKSIYTLLGIKEEAS